MTYEKEEKEAKEKKEEKVRIVYFKIGKKPEVGTMINSVQGMQEAIGGYAQALHIGDEMIILCDEEGIIPRYPK